MQTAGQVGPIDGQPPLTPRTPAPSTDGEEAESKHLENTIESGAPRDTTEEERLANLAESIHINPLFMTTMTETREQMGREQTYIQREITDEINPHMGHQQE